MKFLVVTLGSIGDLMPFLAIADALRQRGHQVVIASNAGYAALVTGSGFEFGIVSDRPQQALDDVLNPIRVRPGREFGTRSSFRQQARHANSSPIMRRRGRAR